MVLLQWKNLMSICFQIFVNFSQSSSVGCMEIGDSSSCFLYTYIFCIDFFFIKGNKYTSLVYLFTSISCVWVVLVLVFMCTMCMLGTMRPKEGIIATKIGVAGICESPGGCLEPKSRPLKKQSMRLTAEESFQPQCAIVFKKAKGWLTGGQGEGEEGGRSQSRRGRH